MLWLILLKAQACNNGFNQFQYFFIPAYAITRDGLLEELDGFNA
jgi:hypothetical protein